MRIEFSRFFGVVIVVLTLHGTDNFKLTNSEDKGNERVLQNLQSNKFVKLYLQSMLCRSHKYDGKVNGSISQCKSAMYMQNLCHIMYRLNMIFCQQNSKNIGVVSPWIYLGNSQKDNSHGHFCLIAMQIFRKSRGDFLQFQP